MAKRSAADEGGPKRYGSLVRVSDEFAAALNRAANMEGISARKFADAHLLPVVTKRYQEAVLKEAARIGESKALKPKRARPEPPER